VLPDVISGGLKYVCELAALPQAQLLD